MNFSLLVTTIATSTADSFNPVAIMQQFVLQGMVTKRHHIWYFITATFLTNFLCGIFAYYGLLTLLAVIWNGIKNTGWIPAAELLIGLAILIWTGFTKHKTKKDKPTETEFKQKTKSVRPLSLFLLGLTATLLELSSALPYFAFISVLANYRLNIVELLLVQALYNLIYVSPLIVLYLIYIKQQRLFDRVYHKMKNVMSYCSEYILPVVCSLAALCLIIHGVTQFLT